MSELTTVLNTTQSVSVFGNMDSFKEAQRMIVPLMNSTMVPDAYKGNAANCMVAMEMSHRVKKSVLEIMQNMQVVKGNVGWKSEYVISEINRSGIFKEPLDFIFSDDRQSCYAVAVRKSNGKELRGTVVSMELALAEGWLNKPGSKWKTMPEQMLMYRAATFFCRVFCPEVLAGVQTADEIIDIGETESAGQVEAIRKFNAQVAPETKTEDFATETNFEEVNETQSAPVESDSGPGPAEPDPDDADFNFDESIEEKDSDDF